MTDIPYKSDVLTLSWPFWQGIPTLKVKPPNSIFITTNAETELVRKMINVAYKTNSMNLLCVEFVKA